MRRVAWVLALLLVLAGCDASDSEPHVQHGFDMSWQPRATAPFPAHTGSVLVEVGDKVFLLGGTRHRNCTGMMTCPVGGEIRRMVAYDPAGDRWSRLPDLPGHLLPQPQVTTLGDKLIATNGDNFEVFDLSTEEWTSYPPPPLDPANATRLVAHGRAVYTLTAPSNPQSPVQRLDLRTGDWSVLTRGGLGAATTRSIFWTQVGLVSAGYDHSSGTPVPAVATYAHGTWHRYAAPPLPVSPAPFILWGATIVIAAPPHGRAQGLDPVSGKWLRVPGSLARSVFLPDGRPAIPPRGADNVVLFHEQRLYKLNGRSRFWEQPFNIA